MILSFLFSEQVKSPVFVIDIQKLKQNVQILDTIQKNTGTKILLALKAFSTFKTFNVLSRAQNGPLYGTCASSVDEARLGYEEFGGEVHAFSPAWTIDEIRELLPIVDHIIFNSEAQLLEHKSTIKNWNLQNPNKIIQIGLRINPEHSEGQVAIYNPCSPNSRLGIRHAQFHDKLIENIDGLHFHTLCEQGAEELSRTLSAVENNFGKYLLKCKWINMGGGHHITKENYNLNLLSTCLNNWHKKYKTQIYLEPGEAIALNAGFLVTTVLDIVTADYPVAILDISPTCHMPDVLEMPYRPEIYYLDNNIHKKAKNINEQNNFAYRIAGKSCLAGDEIGIYTFDIKLKKGMKLIFSDMAIYSMVKTTTFNGMRLPAIGIYNENNNFDLVRTFTYKDFKNRLS